MNEPVTPSQIKTLDLSEAEVQLANIDQYYGDYYRRLARAKEERVAEPEDPHLHREIVFSRAVLKSQARVIGRNIRHFGAWIILPILQRLNNLEEKQSGVASASVVAALQEQVRQLRTENDKMKQQISSVQKHNQALERKYGGMK